MKHEPRPEVIAATHSAIQQLQEQIVKAVIEAKDHGIDHNDVVCMFKSDAAVPTAEKGEPKMAVLMAGNTMSKESARKLFRLDDDTSMFKEGELDIPLDIYEARVILIMMGTISHHILRYDVPIDKTIRDEIVRKHNAKLD